MKIDIAQIPGLDTEIAIYGANKQVEVGGPVCLGFLIAVGLMLGGD